jgi:hypothetical protein
LIGHREEEQRLLSNLTHSDDDRGSFQMNHFLNKFHFMTDAGE